MATAGTVAAVSGYTLTLDVVPGVDLLSMYNSAAYAACMTDYCSGDETVACDSSDQCPGDDWCAEQWDRQCPHGYRVARLDCVRIDDEWVPVNNPAGLDALAAAESQVGSGFLLKWPHAVWQRGPIRLGHDEKWCYTRPRFGPTDEAQRQALGLSPEGGPMERNGLYGVPPRDICSAGYNASQADFFKDYGEDYNRCAQFAPWRADAFLNVQPRRFASADAMDDAMWASQVRRCCPPPWRLERVRAIVTERAHYLTTAPAPRPRARGRHLTRVCSAPPPRVMPGLQPCARVCTT